MLSHLNWGAYGAVVRISYRRVYGNDTWDQTDSKHFLGPRDDSAVVAWAEDKTKPVHTRYNDYTCTPWAIRDCEPLDRRVLVVHFSYIPGIKLSVSRTPFYLYSTRKYWCALPADKDYPSRYVCGSSNHQAFKDTFVVDDRRLKDGVFGLNGWIDVSDLENRSRGNLIKEVRKRCAKFVDEYEDNMHALLKQIKEKIEQED